MPSPRAARRLVRVVGLIAVLALAACSEGSDEKPGSGGSPSSDPVAASDGGEPPAPSSEVPSFVLDVGEALAAVEAELGAGQEYFEITANAQFTNVFVAVDGAAAAVPYLYLDGELQPPAPRQDGASGQTFTAADVDFEPDEIVAGVAAELPDTSIDALSVYGDGSGAVYVLGATSPAGGVLDIQVGPDGSVLAVDPVN